MEVSAAAQGGKAVRVTGAAGAAPLPDGQLMRAVRISLAVLLALVTLTGVAHAEKKKKSHGPGIQKRVAEKLLAAYELMQKENYVESLKIIDDLSESKKLGPPEWAQVYRFRGYIFVNQGKTEAAAGEFEKSL